MRRPLPSALREACEGIFGPGLTADSRAGNGAHGLGEQGPRPRVEGAAELGREPGQGFGAVRIDATVQKDRLELVLGAVDFGLATAELLRLAEPTGLRVQHGEPLEGLGVTGIIPEQGR